MCDRIPQRPGRAPRGERTDGCGRQTEWPIPGQIVDCRPGHALRRCTRRDFALTSFWIAPHRWNVRATDWQLVGNILARIKFTYVSGNLGRNEGRDEMILKLTLTAGLALGLGGQALAMTCADLESAAEYAEYLKESFRDCGLDLAEDEVRGLLASLQSTIPASGMPADVPNGDINGDPSAPSGFPGGTPSATPSDGSDPTPVTAMNDETGEDMSGGNPLVIPGMPVDEDGRPTPDDAPSDPLGVVPLPAGGLLLIGGLGGLGLLRRTRKTTS